MPVPKPTLSRWSSTPKQEEHKCVSARIVGIQIFLEQLPTFDDNSDTVDALQKLVEPFIKLEPAFARRTSWQKISPRAISARTAYISTGEAAAHGREPWNDGVALRPTKTA